MEILNAHLCYNHGHKSIFVPNDKVNEVYKFAFAASVNYDSCWNISVIILLNNKTIYIFVRSS